MEFDQIGHREVLEVVSLEVSHVMCHDHAGCALSMGGDLGSDSVSISGQTLHLGEVVLDGGLDLVVGVSDCGVDLSNLVLVGGGLVVDSIPSEELVGQLGEIGVVSDIIKSTSDQGMDRFSTSFGSEGVVQTHEVVEVSSVMGHRVSHGRVG